MSSHYFTSRRQSFRRSAAIAALLITAATACSNESETPTEGTNTTISSQARGGSARVDAADSTKIIVSQTVKVPTKPEDTVEIGVESLKVEGKLMTLRLVYTPRFTSVANDATMNFFTAAGGQNFAPYLLDRTNLKRYDIVTSAKGSFKTSDTNTRAVNGSSLVAFAVFAAPEDGAKTFDIVISDAYPAFKDVAVTQ